MILGMDIGGTNIRAGLVDKDYRVWNFVIESSTAVFNSQNSIDRLIDFISGYCAKYAGGKMPRAISIGFPSTLDKNRKRLLSSPNIRGFDDVDIVKIIKETLKVPVFIDRDANMLILYDIYYHKIKDADVIIGCYIGTGIGNAVCINGELLTGKNGVAAELGHIPVLGRKEKCTCGNEACLEIYASGKYLEDLQKKRFSRTPIDKLFTRHKDSPHILEFIDYLSIPIAIEINIFDPDYIIIGGGIVQMEDFPMELFLHNIRRHSRKPYPEVNLQFIFSAENRENGVIGAGIHGYRILEKEISYDRAGK